jgi:hypothetical protein
VSLDRSKPYGSWRWGGPEWTGATGRGAPGALAGVTLSVHDPANVASLWAKVLGVGDPAPSDARRLALDGAAVQFEQALPEAPERLSEIALELPGSLPGGAETVELLGVRLRRT